MWARGDTVAVFDIIVWPLLVMLSLAVSYLYILALFGLLDRRRRPQPSDNWRTLILIPAHNEEDGIDTSLNALERLEPFGAHEIVVVADNCSDNTAEVVRERGESVLERIDLSNRGKGYALQWAVDKLDVGSFDVVVVIDADTRVEPNMLRAVAASLQYGAGAVQLCNELSVERHTPLAHLQHMANAVENHLFWGGRAKLRLPILLRGTGMAIAAHLLETHPFSGEALAEDTDYSIDLLRNGVWIDFSTDSTVRSAAASSYSQALSQKDRWASGTFQSMRERWWPLVKTGLGRGRGSLRELAWAFLLLSRPFLIYLTVLTMIPAIFADPAMRLWYLGWAAALAMLKRGRRGRGLPTT